MLHADLSKRHWQWLAMLFLSLVWGSSFILMKKGLQSYSFDQVAAFRMLFGSLFMLPLAIKNFRILTKKDTPPLVIVGLVGFAIPAFLFTKAQTRIDSSLAGILNSLTPLFTLIIGLLFYKSKVKFIGIIGIMIGLAGAIGIIYRRDLNLLEGMNAYALLVVAATICYGINANILQYRLPHLGPVQITAVSFFFVGPVSGIYLLFTDFSGVPETPDYILNLAYIAILALFSSAIAIIVFNALIKHTTAIFATSVTYVVPLIAILWGMADGEIISLTQVVWMAVILAGVYLVNKS
jgi:drug/metabolite transporter (DMT)-like permease